MTFKAYSERITGLPAEAIMGALDRECEALRGNLADPHVELSDQAYSILYFKLFVRAAKLGDLLDLTIRLPANEVEFFQKTIVRLVDVEALPPSALEHFRSTFRVLDKNGNVKSRPNQIKNEI